MSCQISSKHSCPAAYSGDKETNVRVQLLSWDTLDTKAFVEYLAFQNNISKGDAYKNLSMILEGIKSILKNGNIINLDDFGSFSLNGVSVKTKNPAKATGQNP